MSAVATTDTERYFFAQLAPGLHVDERILACAYLRPVLAGGGFADVAVGRSAFFALTDERLHMIETRIGVFAPLLENCGVVSVARASITGAALSAREDELWLERDGVARGYRVDRSTTHVASQAEFFDRVLAAWPRSPSLEAALTPPPFVLRAAHVATGVVLTGLSVIARFAAGG
ncbi:MAG: hypothetical protein K8W52_29495 [Deltaproteobacteria bacterium]|nr:hypothetical protein [Deltaproteobacteria bacterium]